MKNQVCFNHLSVQPLCTDNQNIEDRVRQYISTLKSLWDTYGIRKVRYHENLVNIPLTPDLSLFDYCSKNKHRVFTSIILDTFTMPQVDMDDDESMEKYIDCTTNIEKEDKLVEAEGFNAAYCQGVPCVGFKSEEFWKKSIYSIVVNISGKQSRCDWGCVSNPESVKESDFVNWVKSITPVSIIASPLHPSSKKINLRDDHGKDVLYRHAKLLTECQYVEGILTSLPFQPATKKYVYNIRDAGEIDIVLHWEDAGYSMRVKTTGRNIRETTKIATILEKQYGRK